MYKRRRWTCWRACGVLFALCVAALVFVALVVFARQRTFYYQPKRPRRGPTPCSLGVRHWNVLVDNRVDSWWIPASPGRHTVLVCHGNAGNISHRLPLIAILKRAGFGVLIFDYSGYGNTEGQPTEHNLRKDTATVYKWLCKRVGGDRIIVLGQSLGGGVACDLVYQILRSRDSTARGVASSQSHEADVRAILKQCSLPSGLILDSTFTSMPDACAHNMKNTLSFMSSWLKMLVKDKYDTVKKIAQVSKSVQTVVMHTRSDRVVPFKHALLNSHSGRCRLVVMPRGGHNDGYLRNAELYIRTLQTVEGTFSSRPTN